MFTDYFKNLKSNKLMRRQTLGKLQSMNIFFQTYGSNQPKYSLNKISSTYTRRQNDKQLRKLFNLHMQRKVTLFFFVLNLTKKHFDKTFQVLSQRNINKYEIPLERSIYHVN